MKISAISTDDITKAVLHRFPDALGIYLFGSTARGQTSADSDIDIGLFLPYKTDPVHLWEQAQEIARILDCDVDLVDLQAASQVFLHQILSTGRRIYCANKMVCNEFEGRSLAMYLRFNEERKDIIAAILKRGAVF
jgi:predicted nucleotidyltransferase